eukprot:2279859-Pyramimonas_sp.AAC.1
MVCYFYSRYPWNCKGPQSVRYNQRRGLAEAEMITRDKYEGTQLKAGKSLGYQRTTKQADSAAANANSAAPGETPRSRGSSKGRDRNQERGRGKGKDKPCLVFTETGACSRGKDCWFAKNTPGHP